MNQIQIIKIDELVKSLNLFELVSHLLGNVETFSHLSLTAMPRTSHPVPCIPHPASASSIIKRCPFTHIWTTIIPDVIRFGAIEHRFGCGPRKLLFDDMGTPT